MLYVSCSDFDVCCMRMQSSTVLSCACLLLKIHRFLLPFFFFLGYVVGFPRYRAYFCFIPQE